MNKRLLTIVLCALTLSLCVSYLVYRAVAVKSTPGARLHTVPVLVAARDLAVGSLIRDVDWKRVAWSGPVAKGAIADPAALRDRGISSPIYEGELITEARLSQSGSGGGLAGTIPQGMRACAVKVNEVVGVAGFVVPGMRVDVLITGLPPGGDPLSGPRVRTLLQSIRVLSAGTNFQRDQQGKPEQAEVVTLLVTPAQAEILSLAGNETRIQLVLRNPMDTGTVSTPGTMVSDLFGGSSNSEPVNRASPHTLTSASPTAVVPTAVVPNSVMPNSVMPSSVMPSSVMEKPRYTVEELNGATRTQATFGAEQEKR